MEDKFKLGKKWFWIGVVSTIISPLVGLIYGIALLVEKKFKEAVLIIVLAIVLGVIYVWVISFTASKDYQFSPAGKLESIPIETEGGPKIEDVLPQQ